MANVKALAKRSRLIGLSMARAVARNDEPQIVNWATKQATVSTAIAIAVDPSLVEPEPESLDPAVPPPAPDTTPPYTRSTTVFGPWVSAWLKANFDDPTSLQPALVSAKAKEQGVLAAVTAAQLLGYPNDPFAEADFSYYTSFSAESTSDGFVSRVWINGALVAEEKNIDAYGLALANGIEG